MIDLHVFCYVFVVIIGTQSGIPVPPRNEIGGRQVVSFQDVKNYIQPILYQRLRAPGDSEVMQQMKTVVSEYIVNSLLDSAQDQTLIDNEPVKSQRQATNITAAAVTSRPTNIVNVVTGGLNITRPRPSQQHVIQQVDRIVDSVNAGNITGIVDQALRIRAPPGVQQLVNSIMNLVLCNPFNRLWNRCYGGGGLLDGFNRT